jgi:hypothetical protein
MWKIYIENTTRKRLENFCKKSLAKHKLFFNKINGTIEQFYGIRAVIKNINAL